MNLKSWSTVIGLGYIKPTQGTGGGGMVPLLSIGYIKPNQGIGGGEMVPLFLVI